MKVVNGVKAGDQFKLKEEHDWWDKGTIVTVQYVCDDEIHYYEADGREEYIEMVYLEPATFGDVKGQHLSSYLHIITEDLTAVTEELKLRTGQAKELRAKKALLQQAKKALAAIK
jgi:hypothetical protein